MTRLKFYKRLTIVSCLVLVLLNNFAFGFLGFFIPIAKADAITWVGSPSGGFWDNPANWSSGTVPTELDNVTIGGDDMFIVATSTINFASLTLAGPDVRFSLVGGIGVGGDLPISESLFIQSTSTRQTISGTLTINDGVMQHLQNTSTTEYKLDFVAENIVIEPGGHVRVNNEGSPGGEIGEDGYGYGGGDGDTNGSAGAGGSNAGMGGFSSSGNFGGFPSCTFGFAGELGPIHGGSGGGGSQTSTGGDGGGFVRLEANNTLTINGRITADADPEFGGGESAGEGAGGGSGGTIYLVADTINGTPESTITARGGNSFDSNGGGGGGGCVRIRYGTTSTIDGSDIIVDGGVGFENGGAGVVLVEKSDESVRKVYLTATTTPAYGVDQNYTVADTRFIDGTDDITSLSMSTSSRYIVSDSYLVDSFSITGAHPFQGSSPSGTIQFRGDVEVRLRSGASIEDVIFEVYNEDSDRRPELIDDATGQASTLDLTIGNGATFVMRNFSSSTPLHFDTFEIASGGTVTHHENDIPDEPRQMVYIQADDITIADGGLIDVSGKGFFGGSGGGNGYGPGKGEFAYATAVGAGHGGGGTANFSDGTSAGPGGSSYCDVSNPGTLGSGGSSGFFDGVTGRPGGNGGGLVWLMASSSINLSGDIFADGEDGSYDFYTGDIAFESISGAGAGGGVKIYAPAIEGHGEIFARGGDNGVDPDPVPSAYGGGAGGCVLVNYVRTNQVVTSSIHIAGGGLDPGSAEDGQLNTVKENEAPELFLNFYRPDFVNRVTSSVLNGAGDFIVSGDFAYVTSLLGSSLAVLDISSSTNPTIVGTTGSTADLAGIQSLARSGDYIFAGNSVDNSFRVIDISSSTNPTIVGGIEFETATPELLSMALSGNYIYLVAATDSYSSLRIINVSNPASPTVTGSIVNDSNLVFPSKVTISGNYAYISTLGGQFVVVDISNPTAPSVVGIIKDTSIFDNPFGMVISGNYAFVASDDSNSIVVVDISDPSSPQVAKIVTGPVPLIDNPHQISISGNYAYVTLGGSNPGIWVVDISDPPNAHSVGYIIDRDLLTDPAQIAVEGDYVYMTDYSEDSFNVFEKSSIYGADPTIGFDISDGDRETLSVKAEYRAGSCTYSGAAYASFVTSTATSTYGVAINNAAVDGRRITSVVIDPLSDFPITQVTTTWRASSDVPGQEGEYCIFMTPYDGEDEGLRVSATVVVDDPLASPSTPSLSSSRTQTSITLSWGTVGGADHYVVSSTVSEIQTETDETSVTFAGLPMGTSYTFQIKAVDSYGNESAYSSPLTVTTIEASTGGGLPIPPPPDTPSSTPSSTASNPSGLILINHGAYYTNSRSVTVSFNTEFTDAYILSDTPDFTGKIYTPITSSTVYLLNPLDGEKRIYARFSNNYGIYDAYDVIVLDTVAPSPPVVISFASPELVLKSGGVYGRRNATSTVKIKPVLTGTAEPGTRIVITTSYGGTNVVMMALAAVETFYTTADGNGNWSFTFPSELQNTYYTVSVQTEDAAENRSNSVSTELDLRITEAPLCTVNCEPPVEPPPIEVPPIETPPVEQPPTIPPPIQNPETPPDVPSENEPITEENTGGTSGETTTDAPAESESVAESIVSNVTESISVISDTVTSFFAEVSDSLQEIPIIRGIIESATVAAEKTREVIDNPTIEKTNEVVAAPVIAAAAVANVAVGGVSLVSQAMLYLRLIFSQPILLLKLRKRKRWGVVFNAYTKLPLDLATVRLVSGQNNSVMRTQVTDARGRYFMVAENGLYRLEAKKDGFGEQIVITAEDSVYPNVYHGEKIELVEESNNLNYNIPLEPIMEEKSNAHLLREYAKKATHKTISLLGALATFASFIISPKPWISGLLLFHIVLYGFMKRLSHKKIKGTFGTVRDKKTGKEISKVVIRVFDGAYNKLVETGVTDSKGRYAILVGPSNYYITAEKEGYTPYQSDTIDFSSAKTNGAGGVISISFSLESVSLQEKGEKLG